ncbi:Sporulation initiation inhibitor protein Soj [subsurface metagenome]
MIVTIANQKGGQAKTTSVINIGAGLTRLNKKILLIDLDSQTDLSTSLGIAEENIEYTINDVINKKINIKKAIIRLDNRISIIPASHRLTETSMNLKKSDVLKESLKDVKNNYDFVIIDTQPSLSILTVNALATSNEIWITFQPEFLAMTGIKDLLNTIKLLKDKFGIDPEIRILITMYDSRKLLHREATESIRKHFKNIFKTMIRTNVSLAESPSHNLDIFNYKPNSHGAIDYMNLCKEILRKVR